MDMDAIFSFSSPLKTAERVDVTASPVLELAYVGYFLGASKRNDQDREPPWAAVVDAEAPDLRAAFAGFWSDPSGRPAGLEVFVAACQLGYATDATPERFLAELPALPARALRLY
ncbi:MAG TPA: hypothetical protein VF171_07775, partial [Trueperaceae bacterium]